LHVPFVKPEYLLNLNQYFPFYSSHNLSPNHSLIPSVGQKEILSYCRFYTFKILSQTDFASCHKIGDTYFWKGMNDRRTDNTETCLGSLYLHQGQGIQENCKFEIGTAKEQVFRLVHNKWAIATQKQFTTHKVCSKDRKTTRYHYLPRTWLQGPITVTHLDSRHFWERGCWTYSFTWNLKATQIFPDLES